MVDSDVEMDLDRRVSADDACGAVSWWRALRTDVPSALLAIALFMLPLYRTRILEDSFNAPKLALAMLLGVLAAIGLLARSQSFCMKLRWYPAPWLVVGLAVWQAFSVLWSDSKPLGVDGTVYFATFAVLCWLFYRGPRSSAGLRGLFHAGAAGAVLTAVWVLVDDFTGGAGGLVARLPDWRGHLAAGLGNSGHIAGMVGMFLPWVLINFLRVDRNVDSANGNRKGNGRRWLLLPVIGLMFAALTVTWSVGSSGATIVSLLIWAFVAWQHFRIGRGTKKDDSERIDTASARRGGGLRWRRLWAVVAVGLAVMAFYFSPNPLNPHKPSLWKQAFSSARWEAGWPTRVVIWETTWQMIRQNPMVGVGTGNFTFDYARQVVPAVENNPELAPYSGAFTNDAHNDYMQLWAEGGVVALALWMAVLSTFVVSIGRMLREEADSDFALLLIGAGAGMTVFALDGLMSFPMRLPAHFAMAMFFLSVPGVLLRLKGTMKATDRIASDKVPPRRRLRAGGIGILLTLAACVWHHGHRIVSEYYLKQGRTAAEAVVIDTGGMMMPSWRACDAIYQETLRSVAAGASERVWREGLGHMEKLSSGAAMDEAGVYFQAAVDTDRWYANASSRLGQLQLFRNNFSECLKVSRKTLRTLQAYEIHERMGAAAFFAGDYAKAREHWSICLTRRPEDAALYRGLLDRVKP